MASVQYVHDPALRIDLGGHVFPVEKWSILRSLIQSELGVPELRFHGFDQIDDEDLERVHTPGYLADLRAARTTVRTASSELPVTREVIDGFRHMVGGSVAAVRLALEHGVGFHCGGGFHHAFPDHGEGFCYLHDVAIAVERARVESGLGNVLFLDVDVHQGNGTAVVYAEDRESYCYSIHQERNYPLKQRSTLDRALEDGIDDDGYCERLAADIEKIRSEFRPELLCYVGGVDPHRDDQLGGLALTDDGIRRRDEIALRPFLDDGIAVAVFLAGGYAPTPERTARLHLSAARICEEAIA